MAPLQKICSIFLAVCIAFAQDNGKNVPGSLTIEDIIEMSKANIGDEVIITRIRRNAKAFDLNADEIVALRNAGVSAMVIKYLEDPGQPYPPPAPPTPPPPPPPPPPRPKPPSDPLALKVPPEPGIYYLAVDGTFLGLELKPVVPFKQPGKISSLLKGHIIGSVIGSHAKVRAAVSSQIFYVRLAEKGTVEDLTLLALAGSKDRRNLDFGIKPGSPVFPVKSVQPFESKEVSMGLFRVESTLKMPGEYLFFILGSGEEKKGTLGKGYELGVE